MKRNNNNISLLSKVIAACCTLHNLCEVHGDAFDEEWTVVSAEVPNREAAGIVTLGSNDAEHICSVLADYVFED